MSQNEPVPVSMPAAWRAVVLCLILLAPLTAQEQTMGLLRNDSASYRGYTLLFPMWYSETYLVDNEGQLVHSWQSDFKPANSVYLLEDGTLLRTATIDNNVFVGRGAGGRIELLDWDSNVLWRYDYGSDSFCQHHDIEPMPSGNVLMVAWEYKTKEEAVAAGRDPVKLEQDCLWPLHVIEVDPRADSIVWEWHLWDHVVQHYSKSRPNYGVVQDHPELVDLNFTSIYEAYHPDWNHTNTVAYNAELDQIVLSPRQFSEIWIIDHSTSTEEAAGHTGGRYGRGGDLLYRWGNPAAYRRPNEGWRLYGQHDPHWIADSLSGAGRMLILNNGGARPYSSVDEIELPMDSAGFYHLGQDSTYGPELPAWYYRDTVGFFARFISGAQRLPNRNTLICDGPAGRIFEVTPDSQVVWDYINPVSDTGPMTQGEPIPPTSNEVFRAYRYSPDYPAFRGRDLTPKGPIERMPTGIQGPLFDLRAPVLFAPSHVRGSSVVSFASCGGSTELAVFDCTGSRISTLVDLQLAAGRHEIPWPTGSLPAGSYFLRLDNAGTATTRAVVVAH